MSEQAVEWVTGKIVRDASFREALIADPDQTLAYFDLSESEKAWLKRVDFETMEALAQALLPCMGKISTTSRDSFGSLSDALEAYPRTSNGKEEIQEGTLIKS